MSIFLGLAIVLIALIGSGALYYSDIKKMFIEPPVEIPVKNPVETNKVTQYPIHVMEETIENRMESAQQQQLEPQSVAPDIIPGNQHLHSEQQKIKNIELIDTEKQRQQSVAQSQQFGNKMFQETIDPFQPFSQPVQKQQKKNIDSLEAQSRSIYANNTANGHSISQQADGFDKQSGPPKQIKTLKPFLFKHSSVSKKNKPQTQLIRIQKNTDIKSNDNSQTIMTIKQAILVSATKMHNNNWVHVEFDVWVQSSYGQNSNKKVPCYLDTIPDERYLLGELDLKYMNHHILSQSKNGYLWNKYRIKGSCLH